MDELTRFARQLMDRLASRPEGLHRPVSVAEVRNTILPYRAQRRALGLESVEDYETVLLRLVAEERGYVKTMPAAAAARCREELGLPNPDLGILEQLGNATIQVTSLAAGQTMDIEPRPAAIPELFAEPVMPPEDTAPPGEPVAAPTELCGHCHTPIPPGRAVVFCPWCGQRLIPLTCTRCGTELEAEWRHCITCGTSVPDPSRTG